MLWERHMVDCWHVPFRNHFVFERSNWRLPCSLSQSFCGGNVTLEVTIFPFAIILCLKGHIGGCHVPFRGHFVFERSH